MSLKRETPGVLRATDDIVVIGPDEIRKVISEASESPKKRARICAHPGDASPVHEMVIVLERNGYIRPHKHCGLSESLHVISGRIRLLVFTETGAIDRLVELGPPGDERPFFYRMPPERYHALIVETERAVVHEVIQGPRDPAKTTFAPWSPPESEPDTGLRFLFDLTRGEASA